MPVKVCGKPIFIKVYLCCPVTVQAVTTTMWGSLHPLCGHSGACRPQNPATQCSAWCDLANIHVLSERGGVKDTCIPAVVCTCHTVELDCIIEGVKRQVVSDLTSLMLFADRLVRQQLLLLTLTRCTPLCSLHEWRVLLHSQKSRSKKHLFLSQLLHE